MITDFPDDDVVSVGRGDHDNPESFEYFDVEIGEWTESPDLWVWVQTDPGYESVDEVTALAEVERIRATLNRSVSA